MAKRAYDKQTAPDNLITSPQDAIELVDELKNKKQEHLVCLYLNARNGLIKKETISIGILDKSLIHPREIFAVGLELRASGVILVHNHPSGDPTPSEKDKQITKRIAEAGKLMGINVIDFIIVAKNGSRSVLGELSDLTIDKIEYIGEGEQASLFDLLIDANKVNYSGIDANKTVSTGKEEFRFIDLFAGIGGFRFAFEKLGGKCVFSSEWDKYAQITYKAWFGETPVGDIRKINPADIPDHDLLAAGFPCQPFSLAGVSKKNSLGRAHGFKDEKQGNLFFYLAAIIAAKKPPVIFLENVKNLQSHDHGKTWQVITDKLKELNYAIFYKIHDAAHWVPQHRERIFIIGFDKKVFGENPGFKFPDNPVGKPKLKDILEKNPQEKYTLSSHLWQYLQDYAKRHREKGNGFGFGIADPNGITRTLSARYHKDGSEILIEQGATKPPRRLTPQECARLMGFPANYKIVVSDTQAYRQFGNAVVVPAVEATGREVVKMLLSKKSLNHKKN